VVKGLEAQQASAPILTPWGYQILFVREKVPEKKLAFEEMRDYIYRYLYEQEQEKIYKLYIEELKEKTFVKIFPRRA
jgi:parvulin-like peptidyl-prolyl isomerase